jgi:hypothetical protein
MPFKEKEARFFRELKAALAKSRKTAAKACLK